MTPENPVGFPTVRIAKVKYARERVRADHGLFAANLARWELDLARRMREHVP